MWLLVYTFLRSRAHYASWELGAAAEALTEYEWKSLSVFDAGAFPPPSLLNDTLNATDVINIATQYV